MTTQKNLGFGGQWIDLFKTGRHVGKDDQGEDVTVNVTAEFLESVSGNYDPELHEAPACIGHPENDAPAYGWVAGMRVEGEMLQAQFADTDPGFEQIVNDGRYKKRSPKFYLDEKGCGKFPYLRHVAWLGAAPPAVKGMRDVQRHAQFSETEGDTVAFEIEFSEGEGMTTENKSTDAQVEGAVKKFLKEKFPSLFGEEKPATTASFSEADRLKLIDDAKAAATAAFSQELSTRDQKIKDLETQVAGIGTNTSRAGLVSFCETLESDARLPRSFRAMGGVEFLEVLASVPTEKKVATIEFAEVGGARVEKKVEITPLDFMKNWLKALPRYVQFGEQFGDVRLSGSGRDVLDPQSVEDKKVLRAAMGVKDPDTAAK